MEHQRSEEQTGCGCCRRDFLGAMGAMGAAGGMALNYTSLADDDIDRSDDSDERAATIQGAFLYPPSETLQGEWWSWPGIDFNAEGRQRRYMAEIEKIEKSLGIKIEMEEKPLDSQGSVAKFITRVKRSRPDGLLLIPFHHESFAQVDAILAEMRPTSARGKAPSARGKAPSAPGIPSVVFSCLGVKHGSVKQYRRPGVHLIQSLDNFSALAYAMKMFRAWRTIQDSRIISVAGGGETKDATVPFWGTKVRRVSIKRFEKEVERTEIDAAVKDLARTFLKDAYKCIEPSDAAIVAAAQVHFANKRILAEEQGDAIMMDCLRRGEMMPCMSFMTFRDQGIAAGCENDLAATLTLMLVQELFDRPGFQHNPCFETEANHYFASHCTCPSKLNGPDEPAAPHLLRNYAHTNEPTCVPQVFWHKGDQVTMANYVPGKAPGMLIYSGEVVKSYPMPPVGGCRTNVEITINERGDACDVKGHHNVLFLGKHARRLRQFARLFGMNVVI